jgi:hypothetical protein
VNTSKLCHTLVCCSVQCGCSIASEENGEHSSVMLTQMNGSLSTHAKVSLSHYEVDDIDGLIGLFRSFDSKIKTIVGGI